MEARRALGDISICVCSLLGGTERLYRHVGTVRLRKIEPAQTVRLNFRGEEFNFEIASG